MVSKCLLILIAILISASSGINNNSGRSWTVLESDNVQEASQHDGIPGNNSAGYTPSATDPANFINYCSKRNLTNGKSLHQESCNGVVMGDIPSADKMVSTFISFPLAGEVFSPMKPFTVKFKASNLVAGSVTNPNSTFLSAPQSLQDGKVVGHLHTVIQSLTNYIRVDDQNFIVPPDPTKFVFFHTVFGAGDVNGGFSVDVPDGLPIGSYRVCTMAAASNHQPVLMPIVERGHQDDCQKLYVKI